MKLKLKCNSCKEDFDLRYNEISRPDLEDKIGEYFRESCTHCASSNEYHINDVKAYDSYGVNLVGTLVGLSIIVLTTMVFWNKGIITNVGFLIGAGVIGASNYSALTSNSAAFNKYLIRRTPKE